MAEVTEVNPSQKASEDCWHGVTDAKKRKRIQDKLAQRARRLRLRQANSKTTRDDEVAGGSLDPDQENDPICAALDALKSPPPSEDTRVLSLSPRPRSPCSASMGSASGMVYELAYPLTVFGALYINGQILGLSDCRSGADRSPPASPDVPLSLQPTTIQQATVHFRGIDRFPFPKLRDNVITMVAFFDEDELVRDFHMMPTFTIRLGGAPWDPSAWKIEKPFADKWGYLFY